MQLIIIAALAQIAFGAPLTAKGASQSPGTASGNVVQIPAHIPINLCGNSISVIGVLNPAFGNSCTNNSSGLDSTAVAADEATTADAAPADPAAAEAPAEEAATI